MWGGGELLVKLFCPLPWDACRSLHCAYATTTYLYICTYLHHMRKSSCMCTLLTTYRHFHHACTCTCTYSTCTCTCMLPQQREREEAAAAVVKPLRSSRALPHPSAHPHWYAHVRIYACTSGQPRPQYM